MFLISSYKSIYNHSKNKYTLYILPIYGVSFSIRFQQAQNEYVNVSAKPFIVLFIVGQNQTCLFIPSVCPLAVMCRYYCIPRSILLSQKPFDFVFAN